MSEQELVPINENETEIIEGIDKALAVVKEELAPQELGYTLQECKFSATQIQAIRAKTPPQLIRTFKGRGGTELNYVPTAIVIRKLNHVLGNGNWTFKIIKSDIIEGHAIVQGELQVGRNAGNPTAVYSQFGGHPVARNKDGSPVDIGDSLKAATSDCLKKCASMMGFFADVYAPNEFMELREKDGAVETHKASVESAKDKVKRAIMKLPIAKRLKTIEKLEETGEWTVDEIEELKKV